jgi:hypothetical protein
MWKSAPSEGHSFLLVRVSRPKPTAFQILQSTGETWIRRNATSILRIASFLGSLDFFIVDVSHRVSVFGFAS